MNTIKSDIDIKLDAILSIPDEPEDDVNNVDESGEYEPEVATVAHLPVAYESVESSSASDGSDADADYKFVRETLYGVIERGKDALEGALMLAKGSEHPRAYEVTSSLMKNVTDMSKELLALHKTVKETKGLPSGGSPHIQNNTQIVVGSTKDLQSILDKSGIKDKIVMNHDDEEYDKSYT
jgi:hypothetical protein